MGGTLGVADGFEWSLDDTEMHFTDTAEKTIYRGPFRETGELSDVKVFHSGEPHDRLTIDGDALRRLRPQESHGGSAGGASTLRCDLRYRHQNARPPRAELRPMTGFLLQRDGDGPANRVDGCADPRAHAAIGDGRIELRPVDDFTVTRR